MTAPSPWPIANRTGEASPEWPIRSCTCPLSQNVVAQVFCGPRCPRQRFWAAIRNSTLPSGPVIGLSIRSRTVQPSVSSHSRTRSEEHTSELQSLMRLSYAVFCLKKKKIKTKHTHNNIVKCKRLINKKDYILV